MKLHKCGKILPLLAAIAFTSFAEAGGHPAVQRIIVEEQAQDYCPPPQQQVRQRVQRVIVEEQTAPPPVYQQRIFTQRVVTQRFVAQPRLSISINRFHR